MTENSTDFATNVSKFLTDYLPLQRNYSLNTVLSYRDSIKLFISFLTNEKKIKIYSFTMEQLTREIVIEFLEWLRSNGSSISTANQRLAALKSFASFVGMESIEYIAPMQSIRAIKSTKTASKEIQYLESDQMQKLINCPNPNTAVGLRHRVVMTLLYDSGCRVQELCDIKIGDICTNGISTVKLTGKGNKSYCSRVSMAHS